LFYLARDKKRLNLSVKIHLKNPRLLRAVRKKKEAVPGSNLSKTVLRMAGSSLATVRTNVRKLINVKEERHRPTQQNVTNLFRKMGLKEL
jgi:hypothetical protein